MTTLDQWVMGKRSLLLEFWEDWSLNNTLHPDAYPLVHGDAEWEKEFEAWVEDRRLRGGI